MTAGVNVACGACLVKLTVSAIFLVSAVVAACGGGSTPTPAPNQSNPPGPPFTNATPTAPTTTQAPATAQAATPAPPNPGGGGGATATVTLTGGADAGTYVANGNPNCSYGIVGEGVWGAQFSVDAADGELSSIQMVVPDQGVEDAHFSLSVTIGPLTTGTTYSNFDEGQGDVTDNGTSAVMHATTTTAEGVDVEATINCPAVFR